MTSLLEDAQAYQATIQLLVEKYKDMGFTKVVGTEARGFLFGAPLALELGVGFVPVRKPGKLPRQTVAQSYELEYGTDTLEIHVDAINRATKYWWWMTCWRPVVRLKRPLSLSVNWVEKSSTLPS